MYVLYGLQNQTDFINWTRHNQEPSCMLTNCKEKSIAYQIVLNEEFVLV